MNLDKTTMKISDNERPLDDTYTATINISFGKFMGSTSKVVKSVHEIVHKLVAAGADVQLHENVVRKRSY